MRDLQEIEMLIQRGITHTQFEEFRYTDASLTPFQVYGQPIGQGKCKAVRLRLNSRVYNSTNGAAQGFGLVYFGDKTRQQRELNGLDREGTPVIYCQNLNEVYVRAYPIPFNANERYPIVSIMVYHGDELPEGKIMTDKERLDWLWDNQIVKTQFETVQIPTGLTSGKPLGFGKCRAVQVQLNQFGLNSPVTNAMVQCYIGDRTRQDWEVIRGTQYTPIIFCRDLSEVYVRTSYPQNTANLYPFLEVMIYHGHDSEHAILNDELRQAA